MNNLDEHCEIIELIYNTVDKPELWESVLNAIAQYSGSTHGFFTERKGVQGEPISFFESGFSQDYFKKYSEYFYKVDVWSQNLAKYRPNQFHESHKVCDDRAFLHSEIYSDFAKPESIRHSIGLFLGDPYSDLTTEMAFMRSEGQPHYEKHTVRNVNNFIPHIQQVQNLSRRLFKLELKNAAIEDVVNNLEEAIFLVDKNLVIEYCNDSGKKLLECSKLFVGQKDLFKFRENTAQEHLKDIVLKTLNIGDVDFSSAKRYMLVADKEQAYLVTIVPWKRTRAILFGIAPEFGLKISLIPIDTRKLPLIEDLANMFELTLTEADIARCICMGNSLQEIAKMRQTKLSTTRQQVKSILQKMGCSRQVELVIKVLSRCLI